MTEQQSVAQHNAFDQQEYDTMTEIGNNAPHNPQGRELAGKIIIGSVVGFLIAFLTFLIIFMLGMDTFITNGTGFLPFLLGLIAFICTFIGNAMVMGAYNVFFGERYGNFRKMFGFSLLSTAILFVMFVFVYFTAGTRDISNNVAIFMVLAFHIVFGVFIMYNFTEYIPDPQYSGSSLTGNVIGFVLVVVVYLMFYSANQNASTDTQIHYLMILPSLLGYSLIPLCQGLWQKIYYSMYEKGNDFFYIPTKQEVDYVDTIQDEEDGTEDEVNVET